MAEPSYWLSTIADVAAVLGLYQPKERSAPFFTKALSLPTIGEAAIIAIILFDVLESPACEAWATAALEQDSAFGLDGTKWQAPRSGAWARPAGDLFATVARITLTNSDAARYATALERFGAVAAAPTHDTIKKYLSLLTRGELEVKRPKRNVGRAPFVFVQAARLLTKYPKLLLAALGGAPARETRKAACRAESVSPLGWCPRTELDETARKLEALKRNHEVRWRRACIEHAT